MLSPEDKFAFFLGNIQLPPGSRYYFYSKSVQFGEQYRDGELSTIRAVRSAGKRKCAISNSLVMFARNTWRMLGPYYGDGKDSSDGSTIPVAPHIAQAKCNQWGFADITSTRDVTVNDLRKSFGWDRVDTSETRDEHIG